MSDKLRTIEGEIIETKWDIKKIAIGAIVLLVFGFFGFLMLFPARESSSPQAGTLGVNSSRSSSVKSSNDNVPPLPDKEDVERILNDAQSTLSNITYQNLIASQAAIQKLIKDLEKLGGDNNAVGVFCELICRK